MLAERAVRWIRQNETSAPGGVWKSYGTALSRNAERTSVQTWMSFLYKKSNLFIVDQPIQNRRRNLSKKGSLALFPILASESVDQSEQFSPRETPPRPVT